MTGKSAGSQVGAPATRLRRSWHTSTATTTQANQTSIESKADKVKRYKLTVTLSGEQGEVMRMQQSLPMSMLAEFREICQQADLHNKVYDMTMAKRSTSSIAQALNKSTTWVRARQEEMGLLRSANAARKKFGGH